MIVWNRELRLLAWQRAARKSPFVSAFLDYGGDMALDSGDTLDDRGLLEMVFDKSRRVARTFLNNKKKSE